jgi:hypothetical protein
MAGKVRKRIMKGLQYIMPSHNPIIAPKMDVEMGITRAHFNFGRNVIAANIPAIKYNRPTPPMFHNIISTHISN